AHSSSLTSHGFRRAIVTPTQHGITYISTVPQEDHSARTPKQTEGAVTARGSIVTTRLVTRARRVVWSCSLGGT
ncbi:hypothetical protein KYY02_32660, partial [Streptomyces pimonensis]